LKYCHSNKPKGKSTIVKFLAMVLFVAFLINSTLLFVFFEFKRVVIKHEIKTNALLQIPNNQLLKFVKDKDFDDEEFELNGKMYDVVKKEITSKYTIVYCYEDHKETNLNHKIDVLIKSEFSKNPFSKNQQKLIDFLHQIYITSSISNFIFFTQKTNNQHFPYILHIPFEVIFIISPPPKI
jgi:hypothetical protein